MELAKQFDYRSAESRLYKLWEAHRVFDGEVDRNKKPFCVVIPPPNVTGILHMGHVLDNVPQDVLVRWHRMRGFSAVWIPGTDHAGIATQNVVKRELAKEKLTPADLGREKFVDRIWKFREKHGGIIIEQLKRLGCSCDWRRERFTMDEGLSRAVLTAFIHYFEKGLIYKGKRMINWCTVCGTSLSDDEVEHHEQSGNLWYLRYPVVDPAGNPTSEQIIVATTRPETMLGDTGVGVHPDDERYKKYVGKNVFLPLQKRLIPIVADTFVDPTFGTGAVKLTPAHDVNDYEAAKRLNLPLLEVINEKGKMTGQAGEFSGLDRHEARKRVVAALEDQGFLEKTEPYKNSVGQCYRCNSVIEPRLSDQWFVKMRPLAEKAKKAVVDGKIEIIPESERQDYFHWMDSIQDWCISRQLWWGHRIPVYYCSKCNHVMAKVSAPKSCEKCSSQEITQDEDVLDTWFSSQLWPFSTLGWPEKTAELDYWFPNNWLMSGRDILFFWDARMIMSSLELMGDVPFRKLALHGIVVDQQGRKLSKSLGNSPDPLALFDQYGTDAVRASVCFRYPMGRQDTKLSEELYKTGQGLVIKLWNASRLLLLNLKDQKLTFDSSSLGRTKLEDRWVLSQLAKAVEKHDQQLGRSDIVHSFEAVSDFFWNSFCDWYLEAIKPRLLENSADSKEALSVAFHCLRTVLKLFHPYTPFVTEELWQILSEQGIVDSSTDSKKEKVLALSSWPDNLKGSVDHNAEKDFDLLISIVRGVRDVRHHLGIGPKVELTVALNFFDGAGRERFADFSAMTKRLSFTKPFELSDSVTAQKGQIPFKFEGGIGTVQIPSDVDCSGVALKLEKRIAELEKGLAAVHGRLANQGFVSNAPKGLIEEQHAQEKEYRQSIVKLREFQSALK